MTVENLRRFTHSPTTNQFKGGRFGCLMVLKLGLPIGLDYSACAIPSAPPAVDISLCLISLVFALEKDQASKMLPTGPPRVFAPL